MATDASSPLPLAEGAGGGRGAFKPRNTERARQLRRAAMPFERRLWTILGSRGLAGYKFSRQMPIGPNFVDFLCRHTRLVVELDGYSHAGRQQHDARRDAWLRGEAYEVLRLPNAAVMSDLDGVAVEIERALRLRCPPPAPLASGRGEGASPRSDDLPPSHERVGLTG